MYPARPSESEYAPYYGTYVYAAERDISKLNDASVVDLLTVQPVMLRSLLADASDDRFQHSYASGKWTLAESLVHVADTERVFGYRLLSIARGDSTPLPGYDQDAWVPNSGAANRDSADILTDIDVVRASTLSLVHSLSPEALALRGTASGKTVSAGALVWLIAGHFSHHLQITAERYLAKVRGAETK